MKPMHVQVETLPNHLKSQITSILQYLQIVS